MKKLISVLLLGIALYGYVQINGVGDSAVQPPISGSESAEPAHQPIANAYQRKLSGIQVGGAGEVVQVLPDDNKGSRHQRFILRLPSGQTLLVAHNIDLAAKITPLNKGDLVEFFGVYEWNNKGGVIHWTHHDPRGRHIGGWLRHNGRKYQ